jgi:hypothetical protein
VDSNELGLNHGATIFAKGTEGNPAWAELLGIRVDADVPRVC